MDQNPDSFSATLIDLDGNVIIGLRGEFDMDTVSEFETALADIIANGPNDIVFDFSELSFIGSSEIAALISLQNHLVAQERHLAIRSGGPTALKLLQITGVMEFLNVETNLSGE